MRPLTTTILLAVAGMALAFIFLIERKRPGTREIIDRDRSVLQWPAAEVNRVEVVNAAGRFVLERHETMWRIVEPFQDRADPSAISEVLKLAGSTEVIERIGAGNERGKGDLKEFGLDAGNRVQVIFHRSNHAPVSMLVGKSTAYDDSAYVWASIEGSDSGDVVVARTKARALLTRAAGEFRDPALIEAAPENLTRIVIKTPSSEVELERDVSSDDMRHRNEPGLWRMTRPIQERADPEVMDRVIASLVGSRAQGFIPESSADGPPQGEPVVRVTLWTHQNPKSEETLDIFSGEGDLTSLVRSSVRPVVARSSADLLALRLCDAERLRDTALGALDIRRLTTFIVRDQRVGTATMHLVKNRWHLAAEGTVHEANRERIEKIVRLINSTQIVQAHDDPGDLARFGLDRPLVELSFGTPVHSSPSQPAPLDSRNSVVLSFGEIGNRFFARWSDRPSVYRVDASILGEVPREWVHYKNTRILGFPPLNLRQLTVTQAPSPPIELAFDLANGGTWIATREGTDVTAFLDRTRLDRLVNRLSELSVHGWLADPAPAAAALEEPVLSLRLAIEVFTENPATTAVRNIDLVFAPLVKGQSTALYYGRATGEPHVFTMRRDRFEELAAPVLLNRPEARAADQ